MSVCYHLLIIQLCGSFNLFLVISASVWVFFVVFAVGLLHLMCLQLFQIGMFSFESLFMSVLVVLYLFRFFYPCRIILHLLVVVLLPLKHLVIYCSTSLLSLPVFICVSSGECTSSQTLHLSLWPSYVNFGVFLHLFCHHFMSKLFILHFCGDFSVFSVI